jgi:hypothetical protein
MAKHYAGVKWKKVYCQESRAKSSDAAQTFGTVVYLSRNCAYDYIRKHSGNSGHRGRYVPPFSYGIVADDSSASCRVRQHRVVCFADECSVELRTRKTGVFDIRSRESHRADNRLRYPADVCLRLGYSSSSWHAAQTSAWSCPGIIFGAAEPEPGLRRMHDLPLLAPTRS